MTRTNPTLRDAQKPPKPADLAATLRTLRAIHREMDGKAWSPDTCDRIAEHLRVAGFTLREP